MFTIKFHMQARKEPWVKAAESFGLYVEEALPRNSLETVQFVASYASCHTPLWWQTYLWQSLALFSPVLSYGSRPLWPIQYERNKSIKAWGALFTCATMRAIHLEIVESPSTESFLQALRRFMYHHGWPATIISDNGKSFVGAERELRKLVIEGRKQINDFAVLNKVRWIFTTPYSPHQGGIYESLIKQTKWALQVAVGNQVLSWNERSTAFAEVKCLINSRPLRYLSNDPNDLQPLTPNHLLLGRASSCVPQGPFEEVRNPRKRFEFVQSFGDDSFVYTSQCSCEDQSGIPKVAKSRSAMLFFSSISTSHEENGNLP